MFKSALSISLLAISFTSFAVELTDADRAAEARFCEERLTATDSVQQLLMNRTNQLGFTNHGGMANGGVCWWHSRYTRNAAYVAQFRPDLPRLTEQRDIRKLVGDIRQGKKIVVVPGFRNLYEFSVAHYDEIQRKLEEWQTADGIMRFQWVAGLSGSSEVSEADLGRKMDQLFERVSSGEVVYQKLQISGIVSHSWLVLSMQRVDGDSYRLQVIDSNYGGVQTYTYRPGMKSFGGYGNFVPYTGKTKEERRLRRILNRKCSDFIAARDAISEEETEVDPTVAEADGDEN